MTKEEKAQAAQVERRASRMAEASIREYRASIRDAVQARAEELRREARRNPRHPAIAVHVLGQLEHFVVNLCPPPPIDDERAH